MHRTLLIDRASDQKRPIIAAARLIFRKKDHRSGGVR
jgi:hypothetical protein